MKNENDFNRYLSKEFSKRSPELHYLKASDKFTAGVSDFLLWHAGRSAALECKFVSTWPSDKANLLKHTFTGAQKTFLESITLAHGRGVGLVAVGSEKMFYVFREAHIPTNGNWKTGDFRACRYHAYPFKSIDDFVRVWV